MLCLEDTHTNNVWFFIFVGGFSLSILVFLLFPTETINSWKTFVDKVGVEYKSVVWLARSYVSQQLTRLGDVIQWIFGKADMKIMMHKITNKMINWNAQMLPLNYSAFYIHLMFWFVLALA